MDNPTFEAIREHLQEMCDEVLKVKGDSYAASGTGVPDRLGNFRRAGTALGLTPASAGFLYLLKHVDSIATWLRDTEQARRENRLISSVAGGEPIEMRFVDLRNYVDLVHAAVMEMLSSVEK